MWAYILAPLILLGVLIFVHELGHFLFCKLLKVKVEKFSLGFGPKIVGVKIGETEYRISWIPLGGYVKMLGEDPAEFILWDKERAFYSQALWKRFLIVLAGPSFNILFAVVILSLLYMVGFPSRSTLVGSVKLDSPAWKAGLRPQDRITSINGKEVKLASEMERIWDKNAEKELEIVFQRKGKYMKGKVTPLPVTLKNIFNELEVKGDIGIQYHALSTKVGVPVPDSPASIAGIKLGDEVKSVNGIPVNRWYEIEEVMKNTKGPFTVKVERKKKELSFILYLPTPVQGNIPLLLGLEPSELFVNKVMEDSPAKKAGLKPGDKLIKINGEELEDWEDFVNRIKKSPKKPLTLQIRKGKDLMNVEIIPGEEIIEDPFEGEKKIGKIGLIGAGEYIEGEVIYQKHNPISALLKGTTTAWQWTHLTIKSLIKLILGQISVKTVGGPVMILKVAGDSAKSGFFPYFVMMIILSINLGILNLLPIPVLDGGHIAFFMVEFIIGGPLSLRKREIAQQIGISILVVIMLLAFYNDIARFWDDIIGHLKRLGTVF